MNRIFKVINFIIWSGCLTPYIFALMAVTKLGTFYIYDTDPKEIENINLFEWLRFLPLIGSFVCLFGLIILVLSIFINLRISRLNKGVFVFGLILNIISYYFNPFFIHSWFHD